MKTFAQSAFIALLISLITSVTLIHLRLDDEDQKNRPTSEKPSVTLSDLESIQSRINAITTELGPSVVSIIIEKDFQTYRSDPFGFFYEQGDIVTREVGGGTGVIISEDGKILTNKHVISDTQANYVAVTQDGKEYKTTTLSIDPVTDLAVLQIENADEDFSPATFVENSSDVKAGDFVVAIGNTLNEFDNSATFGIVSAMGRSITVGTRGNSEVLSGLIQTDAAINQGNSGGPLVNLAGKVVGINTATSSVGVGIGFAIPYSQRQLENALSSIEQTGGIQRAYLGIYSVQLNAGVAKEFGLLVDAGAYIPDQPDSIVVGSPAAQGGLLPGDVIVSVDGTDLSSSLSLQSVLSTKLPNDIIKIQILRGAETLELSVTLGSVS